jgi:hypothetical protein
MGAKVYIKTTSGTNKTVTYRIGDGYSAFLNNPNKIRHSQLRDLNGDSNYQHITAAEKALITGGVTKGFVIAMAIALG